MVQPGLFPWQCTQRQLPRRHPIAHCCGDLYPEINHSAAARGHDFNEILSPGWTQWAAASPYLTGFNQSSRREKTLSILIAAENHLVSSERSNTDWTQASLQRSDTEGIMGGITSSLFGSNQTSAGTNHMTNDRKPFLKLLGPLPHTHTHTHTHTHSFSSFIH